MILLFFHWTYKVFFNFSHHSKAIMKAQKIFFQFIAEPRRDSFFIFWAVLYIVAISRTSLYSHLIMIMAFDKEWKDVFSWLPFKKNCITMYRWFGDGGWWVVEIDGKYFFFFLHRSLMKLFLFLLLSEKPEKWDISFNHTCLSVNKGVMSVERRKKDEKLSAQFSTFSSFSAFAGDFFFPLLISLPCV